MTQEHRIVLPGMLLACPTLTSPMSLGPTTDVARLDECDVTVDKDCLSTFKLSDALLGANSERRK